MRMDATGERKRGGRESNPQPSDRQSDEGDHNPLVEHHLEAMSGDPHLKPHLTDTAHPQCVLEDSELSQLLSTWPQLPAVIRNGISAMVRAMVPEGQGGSKDA